MGRRKFGNVLQVPKRPGWYVRFSWTGKRLWRYGGSTAAEARQTLSRLQMRLEAGVDLRAALHEVCGDDLPPAAPVATAADIPAAMTFQEAVPKYTAFAQTWKRPSTLRAEVFRFRILNGAEWAAKRLTDIRRQDLALWSDDRLKSGVSGVTINHDLNLGSALFEWAIERGYVEENPFKLVRRFKMRGGVKDTFLTPEECRSLIATASTTMRPVLTLALSTGMRRGEIVTLTWSAVDLAAGKITLSPDLTKSGRTRVIDITQDLHRELVRVREQSTTKAIDGSDAVFKRHNGRLNGRPITDCVLRHGMKAALAACTGIPDEKKKKITFHTLRHTAASLMASVGASTFDIGYVLGHKSGDLRTTLRYSHPSAESGRVAIQKLGQVLGLAAV